MAQAASFSYVKILGEKIFAHGRFPRSGSKQKTEKKRERKKERTGTAGGSGGRDRTLAVKSRKNA